MIGNLKDRTGALIVRGVDNAADLTYTACCKCSKSKNLAQCWHCGGFQEEKRFMMILRVTIVASGPEFWGASVPPIAAR